MAAYCAILHQSTGYSPNYLMFARENKALAVLFGIPNEDTTYFLCTFVFVCMCVLYAFVPRLLNQHIDNLFSLWAASIDKHHCFTGSSSLHFFLVYISLSHCAQLIIKLID